MVDPSVTLRVSLDAKELNSGVGQAKRTIGSLDETANKVGADGAAGVRRGHGRQRSRRSGEGVGAHRFGTGPSKPRNHHSADSTANTAKKTSRPIAQWVNSATRTATRSAALMAWLSVLMERASGHGVFNRVRAAHGRPMRRRRK